MPSRHPVSSSSSFFSAPSLLAAFCLLLSMSSAWAAKPVWKPVAELLVLSVSQSDPVSLSEVMSRCTALNVILASLSSDHSPDLSRRYRTEAEDFIQHTVLIDSSIEEEMTGEAADLDRISNAAISKVDDLVDGYNEWLDDNMETLNSPFSMDFDREVESCQLASRFARSR